MALRDPELGLRKFRLPGLCVRVRRKDEDPQRSSLEPSDPQCKPSGGRPHATADTDGRRRKEWQQRDHDHLGAGLPESLRPAHSLLAKTKPAGCMKDGHLLRAMLWGIERYGPMEQSLRSARP